MTLDLSAAFGEPASARLRGLLPRRGRETDDGPDPAPPPPGDATSPPDDDAPRMHRATTARGTTPDGTPPGDSPSRTRPAAPPAARVATPARPSTGGSKAPTRGSTGNRRWGMARVTSREHVDFLVLTALVPGPNHARGIIERLHAGSGGTLEAPERTMYTTLHRLTRNRLLRRVAPGPRGGPRYALTEAGRRAVDARVRQWRTFARAVDGVIALNDSE
ncbi:PadR family transcriptional regulator [Actinomycetospora atypica]|uniref:PadR family transcriptional regulator n=1 Tax=Actinomycetospora atypica TaxID=1290095 RepID=A0ABV9YL02_9PSEU